MTRQHVLKIAYRNQYHNHVVAKRPAGRATKPSHIKSKQFYIELLLRDKTRDGQNMIDTIKRYQVVIICTLLLFCITALYFAPVVFSSKTFASRDMYAFYYPRQLFASECIKNGFLPLWNPHLASGVPFLANLQSSVFYPVSLIYYLLPFEWGFKYFIVLHYFLAGLWMFLLMRHWKYEAASCMVSAIVFMLGGYMVSILDNVSFLTASAWLPLIVLLYDRFLNEKKQLYLILTGVVIGLQVLGGDASCYVLSTFIFMIAYHMYYLTSKNHLRSGEKVRSLSFLPCVWLIGISLAAVVLVPFAEFVSYSTRLEGFSYEEMTKWSYHPLELLQLFVPYVFGSTVPMCRWFGQFWLDTFYLGVFPILLVIFSLWWGRNRLKFFLIGVGVFSFFMAFGNYNPLFPLFRYVPGLNMIHYPVKYLFLAGFSFSILAGLGFSALFERLKQKEIKGLNLLLIILNCSAVCILLAGVIADDRLFKAFQHIYPQTLFHKIVGAQAAYLAIFTGYSIFVVILAAVSMLIIFTARGSISITAAKITAILLLLADLTFIGKPKDILLKSADYSRPNEVVRLLKSDPSPHRIFSLAYATFEGFMHIPNVPFAGTFETLKAFMMPNLPLLFGIDSIDEYAEMLVTRYYALFHPVKEFYKPEDAASMPEHFCRQMLNLLNVKYLISSYRLDDNSFKLIQGGPVKIYENQYLLLRAFFVSNADVYTDDAEVLKAMQEPTFDPKASVLLTREEYHKIGEGAAGERLSQGGAATEVKILKYFPNQVEIETIGNDKGFLILSDNYYPGWKVRVNGKEKSILRVYYNLRGVYLPAGNNEVTFTFDPLSFKIGAVVSGSAFLGVLIFVLSGRKGTDVAC
jgi:uncharacterized membrane protein YfhO